jgi:phosphatidylglycerophosphatase C
MSATVIWDVDGTLIHGDSLLPFLRQVCGTATLTRTLVDAMAQPGRAVAKQLVLQRALGGREMSSVGAVATRFVAERLIRRVRPDCLRRWQWHRGHGHRMVLASASLDLYLDHFGRLLGADEVVCTRMETVNGRLTGRMATPNCRGPAKVRRVDDVLAAHPGDLVWVYADGRADAPLRDRADIAIRVSRWRSLPELMEV